MRGRKPKLTVVHGGVAIGRCPAPPAWFTPHAVREWNRVAPILHSRGLLAEDTSATIENYCVAVGQVRQFEEVMQADGHMVQTDDGPKIHPAFRMQQAAMREARLLAVEMGVTPHCRGKHQDGDPASDPWEGLAG
jgi:P27 family predicted phage terminase small subunit